MYTMFHETFHLDGFSDAQLEADLGIPSTVVKVRGRTSITDQLMMTCGK